MFALKDRLNLLIESSRVSKLELARIAGVSSQVIHRICTGRSTDPTARTVLAIADVTGCTTDWLLGRPVLGPTPAAIRHSIRARGGRLMERAGEPDPIHDTPGQSRRGKIARSNRGGRSALVQSPPDLPPPPFDEEEKTA